MRRRATEIAPMIIVWVAARWESGPDTNTARSRLARRPGRSDCHASPSSVSPRREGPVIGEDGEQLLHDRPAHAKNACRGRLPPPANSLLKPS